jgi:hypothetical protein
MLILGMLILFFREAILFSNEAANFLKFAASKKKSVVFACFSSFLFRPIRFFAQK